ncbi:hypothetical protein AVEN_108235-1 [Araneus ventricosus]|uniref:Uncharacterized protein n=2 Tax=Araneus ventricosus TaxID=182803 RepID=A0A4Y2UV36_ARAVE|nr:hypothetical protein AVEN_108235-1 [Araneus ventricosus]
MQHFRRCISSACAIMTTNMLKYVKREIQRRFKVCIELMESSLNTENTGCLLIDTDICKIPGYPLLKCQKVVADRFSEEVDGKTE